ncbi:hypothetical protein C162_12311 [Paenibacillus sp. FSL R7-269]|uniref:hypothetical protein n=1 Tax=Paenibacillus sp. FSL R7-269 TaxID=1226755 RepID=UPI0003E22E4F|nr:hypothetical protein [Paenibacillus sp. FSL R7-269]ETT50019.1 hypothetical protein C162_12311 [Paenibacillus sp. FSL R7-269]
MSPIRSKTTTLAAGTVLSLSLLLGCSSQNTSATGTPAAEPASSALVSASASPSATPTAQTISSAPTASVVASETASAATPVTTAGLTSQFPPEGLAGSVIIDSVNAEGTVRARTSAGPGELLMIASGPEERGHLNVSSNDGLEGEQTYQADYSIVYQTGDQDEVLLELPAFLFVQPTDRVLKFAVVSFAKAEVYLLAPQYKSGHGLVAYAFAREKESGKVFPLSFKLGEIVHDTLVYSELPPFPANQNEQLVVYLPVGAGGDPEPGPQRYEMDLAKRQFVAQ